MIGFERQCGPLPVRQSGLKNDLTAARARRSRAAAFDADVTRMAHLNVSAPRLRPGALQRIEEHIMRIFVAGATGAVGHYLVPALIAAGHSVIGTTRRAAKADLVHRLGAEAVVADGLDAE